MAIDIGTVTLSIKERTHRIELLSPVGEDARLVVYREKVWIDEGGNVVRREHAGDVRRTLTEIGEMRIGPVTGSELAGLISQAADVLRQQDIDTAGLKIIHLQLIELIIQKVILKGILE